MVPIGLFLLFLTGVGPLFAWRRTSIESLRRNFQMPGHCDRWCWWPRCSPPACAIRMR